MQLTFHWEIELLSNENERNTYHIMLSSFSNLCVSSSSKLYRGKMWASPSVSRVGSKCNWHFGLALMFVISAHKSRHGYLWDAAIFVLSSLKKKLVLPRAHKMDRGLSLVTGSRKARFANLLLNQFLPKAQFSFTARWSLVMQSRRLAASMDVIQENHSNCPFIFNVCFYYL